ncbi:glycosyltransferase [Paractinoplanes brasiliensis]|uniref:GT2 family glycosyltransferase n=1 Tax=Paractinoplanes brasiliensis TaxID=52695 RepID=A0A4R6JYX0_9ACTN|nr:glycosyltransferase [Actinoplanes brasiliensis]TDO42050.1 GT2 family glycosyltransferase [Actinoplanes brasiliensis]GID33074.1 hypothetical protein Abr02nite_80570 [Actinoplanes brasiliensis]
MTGEFLPEVSVIIPTYNRRDLLVESLGHFTRQSLPADRFEVIVADDGSTDDTKAVVESFADRLQIKYFYQEDQGFRAGTARNAGARMAVAPVLVFLDTGEMAGPDFLKHHLAAYADGAHRAVIGYGYGYHYVQTQDTVREMLDKLAPEEIVAKFHDDPAFSDVRHETWAKTDFVLAGRPMPWLTYWSLNCSVRRDDFWAVGGFDEELLGWGPEDIELGMRLHQYGVEMVLSRDAWVVASPHERDWTSNYQDAQRNLGRMLRRHPGPITELCWGITATTTSGALFPWEDEYHALTVWLQKVRDVDVRGEVEQALRTLGPVRKVAVMGSGGQAPDALPPWSVLIDFDDELVKRAAADSGHLGYHSMGLRLPVADKSVDAVIVTSRMSGLWGRWGDLITNELERIAGTVHLVDGVGR